MTTETELRELLTVQADGSTRGSGGWDDVVRRGHHRQRVRRVQRLAVFALLASVAVLAIALPSHDSNVDTTPPAGEPTDTTIDDGPTTPSSIELPDIFRISAVRAQGAFLTVAMLWERGAFDPCTELHPRVVESSEQVGIELVNTSVERGQAWSGCGVGDGGAWGTLELEDPLGSRTVADLTTGYEVTVIDGAPLLFPTELPAPFVLEQRYEAGHRQSARDEQGDLTAVTSWAFSWRAGMSELRVSIDETPSADGCDGESQSVSVRGTTASVCRGPAVTGAGGDDGVTYDVGWEEEGGSVIRVIYQSIAEPPLSLDEVLAIIEGMEPLGG